MVHHGNEKVEKDDDVDEREAAEHDEAPEPCELLDSCQLKVIKINEPECCPEQSLRCFPQTAMTIIDDISSFLIFQIFLLCKLPVCEAMVDLNDNLVISLIRHLGQDIIKTS